MNRPASASYAPLARRLREQYTEKIASQVPAFGEAVRSRLLDLVDRSESTRQAHERRDAAMEFDRLRAQWVEGTTQALRRRASAMAPSTATAPAPSLGLELIGDDVVEKKIIASRLSMAIHEQVNFELNDLKVRMQVLDGGQELGADDPFRPEAVAHLVVDQWMEAGLPRQTWLLVGDVIQQQLVPVVVEGIRAANKHLIELGIVPDIDLSRRVRRGAAPAARRAGSAESPTPEGAEPGGPAGASVPGGLPQGAGSGPAGGAGGQAGQGGAGGGSPRGSGYGGPGTDAPSAGAAAAGGAFGSSAQGQGAPGGAIGPGRSMEGGAQRAPTAAGGLGGRGGPGGGSNAPMVPGQAMGGGPAAVAARAGGGPGGPAPAGDFGGSAASSDGYARAGGPPAWPGLGGGMGSGLPGGDAFGGETSTPLARARGRAQALIGQLRRLLATHVAGFDPSQPVQATPSLSRAVSLQASQIQTQVQPREGGEDDSFFFFDNAAVQEVARDLRHRSGELKKAASTSGEKAVIEIVALMFQSILAEERIPAAARLWFARLQMPVLRIALSEPEFFGSLQHPARQLIDRMGACVLGFDASGISGSALEGEIRRVVQLIEQYPDAGRKAFELAYAEFQKFLSRFLTESGSTQRLVSVAQQVEQKETMAVRYTIELRKMLEDMPVRDDIREFMFKVWAEVLAVAAVKFGPQHPETLVLKKSASELIWAASAKPNRHERAEVIQGLPALLQRLRQGMTLMGLDGSEQELQIKRIGDTLADAFQSKTAAIPQARIDSIAQRLSNIEDFVGNDPEGDLPLVAESIEMMLGVDAQGIEVITGGGQAPNAAMHAWARELQPGAWFSLDHNRHVEPVQYVWRSERGQLHLFASGSGRSFLIQLGRLAAYLQAGLIKPVEEEALTVRATRDALAKLDANPERLLA